MPQNFWQFESCLITSLCRTLDSEPQTRRFASDGYAYCEQQFEAYYGSAANDMWTVAGHRHFSLQIIHRDTILNRYNFHLFLQEHRLAWPVQGFTEGLRLLHEVEGMEEYIPAQFWPYEPIVCAYLQVGLSLPPRYAFHPVFDVNSSAAPLSTNWMQIPWAYKSAIFPFAEHPQGLDLLAAFINAGGLLSKPIFAMAYRAEHGTHEPQYRGKLAAIATASSTTD